MSSEDVIELGSSDEETREPSPKKRKPIPNAMVRIPSKLHEVTIKPTKPGLPIVIARKEINVPNVVNARMVNNNKAVKKIVPTTKMKPKLSYNPYTDQRKPVIHPIKPCNSSVTFVKSPSMKNVMPKIQNIGVTQVLKMPAKMQNNVNKINLPSSITVKRTVSSRPILTLNVNKKKPVKLSKVTSNEVLTVELDDDDATASNSPQWYIRPEEQAVPIEEQNNKEPNTSKFIEITIEDSPTKVVIPSLNKINKVRTETAIEIDDSPVKALADKKHESVSDNEYECVNNEERQSKKKLEYPKEAESNKTIEIEIEDISVVRVSNEKVNDKLEENTTSKDEIKSNDKTEQQILPETTDIKTSEPENGDLSEFHPVYRNFINLCFELENTDDMRKIVEKKIKGYYRQVPKEYTESEEFTDLVSSKILSMKAGPHNMYLYIKDIVDELNMQRKLAKSHPIAQETKIEEPIQLFGESSRCNTKRERQIRKLEKTIKKLHRAIQKLEEQEVDFDDDDDSVYLLTERYKERMVRVYAKFCQLSNTKMPSEPRIVLDTRPGQPIGPAKRLEKWINKKVPIGTPLPFPDFHDVLRCVKEANIEDKLGFNDADIMEEARDLFVRCGKKLQRRRQENEWRLAASRINLDEDPAEKNIDLQKKLSENKKIAAQKENEIFTKYADRQNQLKLEAVEIGDKEAEESPVESEDEEEDINNQNVSLENTERRKERLKRLIQEQIKKSNEDKEIQTSNENQTNDKANLETEISGQEITTTSKGTVKDKEIVTETVTETKTGSDGNETDKTAPAAKGSESRDKVQSKNEGLETDDRKDGDINTKDSINTEKCTENTTETLTLSDSDELESDIDELHLLQKLHKTNTDQSSSVDTSDSDSPIAISDSLDSGEDNRKTLDDDVISIENSSYSEADNDSVEYAQEIETDSVQPFDKDMSCVDTEMVSATDDNAMDVEFSCDIDREVPTCTTNDHDKNSADVLLGYAEEDNSGPADGACFNSNDDLISIDETVIGVKNGTDATEANPTSANPHSKSEISKDNLIINCVESNIESPPETDIPVDKCNQDDKSNETPTDVLTINSVESDCKSLDETEIALDKPTVLYLDSEKCSQSGENTQGNDDLNCELLDSSQKSGDVVFIDDNALSESNILDSEVLDENSDECRQVEQNVDDIATIDIRNSIEFINETPEEGLKKNCDVVFLEDHSNEIVENMDVEHDNNGANEMRTFQAQEVNVLTRRTEIS